MDDKFLADFSEEQNIPPAWTMVTGTTLPGVVVRGAGIGGAYGLTKWNNTETNRVRKNAYKLVTKTRLVDKFKILKKLPFLN